MTLLEKLKPQYKTILDSENKEYPDLVGSVVDDLESTEYVHSLMYGTVMNLHLLFNTTVSPYELFKEI